MESDVSMYFLGAMRVLEVGAEVTCAMPHPRLGTDHVPHGRFWTPEKVIAHVC